MLQCTSILLEAIALKTCVRAVYNNGAVTLAPHILYQRHDELFIDAITVERDNRPPREVKLGTFKLTGLRDLALAGRSSPSEASIPAIPAMQAPLCSPSAWTRPENRVAGEEKSAHKEATD